MRRACPIGQLQTSWPVSSLNERISADGFLAPEDLGPRTKDALRMLAAESEFLRPPADGTPGDPVPAADRQQALLAKVREYTRTYLDNLPNFACTRMTRPYDDAGRPWGNRFTYIQLVAQGNLDRTDL